MKSCQLTVVTMAMLLGASAAIASQEELVTVTVSGETLGEVLERLAADYGYTFGVPPGDIATRPGPHLYIEPTPAPQAFDRLAAAYGLCAMVDDQAMVDHRKFVRILPCDAVQRFREVLRDASTVESPKVRLGVVTEDGNAEGASGTGVRGAVVVEFFDEQLPGFAAGIRVGDAIVSYDGEPVSGNPDLKKLVGRSHPGDAVPVVVVRKGQQITFTVQY